MLFKSLMGGKTTKTFNKTNKIKPDSSKNKQINQRNT